MNLLKWITGNPILSGVIAAILIAAIVSFFAFWSRENARAENNLKHTGAVEERLKTNEETINAVQNAQRPITDADRQRVCDQFDRNCPNRP